MKLTSELEQCFSVTNHIASVTNPLKKLGISGFFYMRIFPDNSFINITSRYEHARNYFHQLYSGKYQPQDLAEQLFTLPGVSLSALNTNNKVWQDANQLGYGNAISLYNNTQKMQEITCFYSTSDNHAINHFYINQLDYLKNFKNFLINQTNSIIQMLEQNKCQLPDFLLSDSATSKILEPNKKPVIVIHEKSQSPLSLAPQRAQCLLHAAQGKSTKQIAHQMNLSIRTIDYYLSIIRKELGCRSTKELIATYREQLKTYF